MNHQSLIHIGLLAKSTAMSPSWFLIRGLAIAGAVTNHTPFIDLATTASRGSKYGFLPKMQFSNRNVNVYASAIGSTLAIDVR